MDTWENVNGMRIHCLETPGTDGSLPPMLMVHGWTGAAADWAPLLQALAYRGRAIAIDLPGNGLSDKPDAPYDVPWFLDFLHAFCATIGASTIVLAGNSMGGQIAVHFTVRYPAIVEKLILVDPYGLKGEEGRRGPLARLGPLVDLAFSLNRRRFIERAIRRNILHSTDPGLLKVAVDSTASSVLGRNGARAVSRVTQRVIGRARVDALLPGISQPVLLLWGEHDRLLPPRWAGAFASLLPRATLHTIPDAGHMPMLERPAEVAEKITRFLEG
jgi:pimeloyl-ACP methyl ester carboxylesterase